MEEKFVLALLSRMLVDFIQAWWSDDFFPIECSDLWLRFLLPLLDRFSTLLLRSSWLSESE